MSRKRKKKGTGRPAPQNRKSPVTVKKLEQLANSMPQRTYRKKNHFGNVAESLQKCQFMSQAAALEVLLSGRNVFISGVAGAGKTTLVKQFIQEARSQKINVGITASTGIAATLLRGRTLHSFMGFGISNDPFDEQAIPKSMKRAKKRLLAIDVLVIDEISMVSAALLDKVDATLRWARHRPNLPFGGVQLVLVGDFTQLPPISKDRDSLDAEFCFDCEAWKQADIASVYLDKPQRAKDEELAYVLKNISLGNGKSEKVRELLESRVGEKLPDDKVVTKLFSLNRLVDETNEKAQAENPSPLKVFPRRNETEKVPGLLKTLTESSRIPHELLLKLGDSVSVTVNISDENVFIPNGALGKVVGFAGTGEDTMIIVKFNSGLRKPIGWHTFKLTESSPTVLGDRVVLEEKTVASCQAIPLRLAYASTIHKSQGQTFDGAEISFSNLFMPGLGYVAISRVSSLDCLSINGYISNKALEVSSKSVEITKKVLQESKILREKVLGEVAESPKPDSVGTQKQKQSS